MGWEGQTEEAAHPDIEDRALGFSVCCRRRRRFREDPVVERELLDSSETAVLDGNANL